MKNKYVQISECVIYCELSLIWQNKCRYKHSDPLCCHAGSRHLEILLKLDSIKLTAVVSNRLSTPQCELQFLSFNAVKVKNPTRMQIQLIDAAGTKSFGYVEND